MIESRVTRRLFSTLLLAGGAGLAYGGFRAALPSDGPAQANEVRYLRIGTGDVGGVYFRIGGILANMISDPDSHSDCSEGGVCGIRGLTAVAQSSGGSVENVTAIEDGNLEAALSQSDVAYWAYRGEELFSAKAFESIRGVANLYSEAVHMAVAVDSPIQGYEDLRGQRVVVGTQGSGSLIGARIILASYDIDFDEITPIYENIARGTAMLEAGDADAVFVISGAPTPSLLPLADRVGFRLLPIDGEHAERIIAGAPFFTRLRITRGQYPGVDDTPTLAVGAQLFVRADLDEELVFELTRALWHPSNRVVLNNGHPIGQRITLETALDGMAVPLHQGAQRYYESALPPIGGPAAEDAPRDEN